MLLTILIAAPLFLVAATIAFIGWCSALIDEAADDLRDDGVTLGPTVYVSVIDMVRKQERDRRTKLNRYLRAASDEFRQRHTAWVDEVYLVLGQGDA